MKLENRRVFGLVREQLASYELYVHDVPLQQAYWRNSKAFKLYSTDSLAIVMVNYLIRNGQTTNIKGRRYDYYR